MYYYRAWGLFIKGPKFRKKKKKKNLNLNTLNDADNKKLYLRIKKYRHLNIVFHTTIIIYSTLNTFYYSYFLFKQQ